MHCSVDPDLPEPDAADGAGLTIEVDGHEAVYATTADLDGDGHDDAVYVGPGEGTTDGGYAYSDASGDGVADTLTEFDARGGVQTRSTFDPATGDWTQRDGAVEPHVITVDTPTGPEVAGTATADTDGDGVPDTAVASTVDGTTLLVTDVDGDGSADLLTEIGSDGSFSSYSHTGAGEWTVVDEGDLSGGWGGPPEPDGGRPATTDPGTGEWTDV